MVVYRKIAGIAQLVERGPEKPGVPSANLGPGTLFISQSRESARVAQLVEQALRKR